ncbi:hypothetical protein HMI54_007554 [Coelomomyces lativittatus]|nr:hypothetical protein HMI54_007554 [Coelomomyces lativittatus]
MYLKQHLTPNAMVYVEGRLTYDTMEWMQRKCSLPYIEISQHQGQVLIFNTLRSLKSLHANEKREKPTKE